MAFNARAKSRNLVAGLDCHGADGLAGALPYPATQTASPGVDPVAFVLAGDVTFRATANLVALVWLVCSGNIPVGLLAAVCFD